MSALPSEPFCIHLESWCCLESTRVLERPENLHSIICGQNRQRWYQTDPQSFCFLLLENLRFSCSHLWLSWKKNNTMEVIISNSYANLSSVVKFACEFVSWKYGPCHATYKIRIYGSVTVFFRWMAEELECFWFLVKIFQTSLKLEQSWWFLTPIRKKLSFIESLVEGKYEGEWSVQQMRLSTGCVQGGWAWFGYLFWNSVHVKRRRKQQRRYWGNHRQECW